jgi:hypothetical protein
MNIIRASKREIWKFMKPIILDQETKSIFYKSMILLVLSKSLTLVAPYCLKITVNALAEASKMDFTLACMAIGAFGLSRLLSTIF